MNIRSAREYNIFAPAQVLRKQRGLRPSSKGDLDSNLTVGEPRVYLLHGVVTDSASGFIVVP
jgi:hypothetical protein